MKTFAITYLTERQARSQISLAIIEKTLNALLLTGYIENTASHGSRAKTFYFDFKHRDCVWATEHPVGNLY